MTSGSSLSSVSSTMLGSPTWAGVADANTYSHRGVITLVPKEASLGLIKWTFNISLFKAAKSIENRTRIQQWRGLRSQPPDPQSFDVGSNVLAMRDSLDLSLSGFRRRLKVPQLPCNGSAARTPVYPVFFDAKKRLKARFLTRTELLWNRPTPDVVELERIFSRWRLCPSPKSPPPVIPSR